MESYQAQFGPYLFGLLISTAFIYVWGIWKNWPKDKIVYHLVPWILSYSLYMVLFIGNINYEARAKYSSYYILPGSALVGCFLSIRYKWEWTTKMVSIAAMIITPWINYVFYGVIPLPIWASLILTLLIGLFAAKYTRQYMEALIDIVNKRLEQRKK